MRLEAACRRALDYDNVSYPTVKTILEKDLDQSPSDEALTGQLHLPMPMAPRFSRDIGSLLKESL